jgi:ACS family sodium-dependent inorganic phosphate cotransporter
MLSGVPIGTVAGLIGSGWLVTRYGWPMAFYGFGVLGLVWCLVWFTQVQNDPHRDPRVSLSERAQLVVDGSATGDREALGLARWLGYPPVWGVVAGNFATTWVLYVLLSWLPSYFREVQHLSIANAGLFSAAPWIAMFCVTQIAAAVSDRWTARGFPVTRMRKLMQCGGLLLSAAVLLMSRDIQAPSFALAILCAATGALGLTWCGYAPGLIDIAPNHSSILNGFSNSIATIPGIVGVSITGWLLDLTGTYTAAFALTSAVSCLGALLFAIFFKAVPLAADASLRET